MAKASKEAKQARKKIPVAKRQGWRTALVITGMCLWVLLAVIAVQLLVGYLMLGILGKAEFSKPVWTAVYSAVVYVIALALVILVPMRLQRQKLARDEIRMELGLMGLPTWTDVGLAPVGFIVSLLLAAGLVGLFSIFPWFDAEEVQNVGFSVYMSGSDRAIAFLTLVVLAPIAEEIIFRGWLYGKIRERLAGRMPEAAGIAISILVVSALFGLVHLQWNVGVNVFALSVVLCALREVTGTIYAGILTHMVKNGVAFFLLYMIGMW